MAGKLDGVQRIKEALEAVMELKRLQSINHTLQSVEQDQEGIRTQAAELKTTCGDADEFSTLRQTAQHWLDRLRAANNEFAELNVALDHGDEKKIQLFSRGFGLQFKVSEDQAIVFTFLHLSKECPEQCANITMDIEAEQWKVLHMEPSLHGVQSLLDQLNDGGELKTFCYQIRQKFKDFFNQRSHNEQ